MFISSNIFENSKISAWKVIVQLKIENEEKNAQGCKHQDKETHSAGVKNWSQSFVNPLMRRWILPTRDFIKGGTAVIWVLFTLGLLCIIYGAAGFIGALKDNKYLIIFYTCGMGFFILVLATLSILFFILYFKLDDNFSCTDLGILKDVDEMNKLG